MKPSCKSAADALAESPIAGLLSQARALGRISAVVADFSRETTGDQISPQLPRCSLQGQVLVITVSSPAQAAKLRQRTTVLTGLLQQCEPDLTKFRIRLQPGMADDPARAAAATPRLAPPPAETLTAALRFADDLCRDLNDSPLRRSALRLRSALRARLGDGQPAQPDAEQTQKGRREP